MAKGNEAKVTDTTAVETTATEPKFNLEKLRSSCTKLFKVTSAYFDGATSDLSADKTYTIKEISQHIESWGKKEAK